MAIPRPLGISQSTVIAAVAIAAFVFYISAKNTLPQYLAVLWGQGVPQTATLQNTVAGAVTQGLGIVGGTVQPGSLPSGGLITGSSGGGLGLGGTGGLL